MNESIKSAMEAAETAMRRGNVWEYMTAEEKAEYESLELQARMAEERCGQLMKAANERMDEQRRQMYHAFSTATIPRSR